MFYDPVKLRTIARFTAADPWSGNQLTDYTLDEYVMLPLGSKRAIESKWSLHSFGIQWENNPRYRLLPESLVQLWKCGQLPSEKLPSVLHAIEPRLMEADFAMSQSWQRSVGIPILLLLLLCPVILLMIAVDGKAMPAVAAIVSGLALALLSGLILWLVNTGKRNRTKQQMAWALNQISPGSSPEPSRKLNSPLGEFFNLYVKVLVVFIGFILLAAGVGAIYIKLYR